MSTTSIAPSPRYIDTCATRHPRPAGRHEGEEIRVVMTVGPWPYRSKTGELMLLWSRWNKDKAYTTSLAFSDNGRLTGNWTHREQRYGHP